MNLNLRVADNRDWATRWLTLYQGMVGYSEREKEVLTELLVVYLDLKPKVLDESLLWQTLFSTTSRKQLMTMLGLSKNAFANYLKTFREHDLLLQAEGYEYLLPALLPQHQFSVTFTSGPTV